jgi:hypothetical protein
VWALNLNRPKSLSCLSFRLLASLPTRHRKGGPRRLILSLSVSPAVPNAPVHAVKTLSLVIQVVGVVVCVSVRVSPRRRLVCPGPGLFPSRPLALDNDREPSDPLILTHALPRLWLTLEIKSNGIPRTETLRERSTHLQIVFQQNNPLDSFRVYENSGLRLTL